MSPPALSALLLTKAVLAAAVLAGLGVRRRWRRCWSVTAYLASAVAFNAIAGLAPGQFFRWDFWLGAQIVQGLLVLVVAAELTLRIVRNLPGARPMARAALLAALLLGLAVMWTGPPPRSGLAAHIASTLTPRLDVARTVVFVCLLVVTRAYRVPLDPWHHAVVTGLALYSALAGVCGESLRVVGWSESDSLGSIVAAGYLLLLLYWNHAAWRTEPDVPEHVARRLWPWR